VPVESKGTRYAAELIEDSLLHPEDKRSCESRGFAMIVP
jgi:hypothetical protein